MNREEAIRNLKTFLQYNFPKYQVFDSGNITGDYTKKVYEEDGITVYWCPHWEYLEIFGLSEREFAELLDRGSLDHLKTFTV